MIAQPPIDGAKLWHDENKMVRKADSTQLGSVNDDSPIRIVATIWADAQAEKPRKSRDSVDSGVAPTLNGMVETTAVESAFMGDGRKD